MNDDSFFDDDGDPGPLPDNVWEAERPKDPEGEISVAHDALHEWVFLGKGNEVIDTLRRWEKVEKGHNVISPSMPVNLYKCRRCGLQVSCLQWENPGGQPLEGEPSCSETLINRVQDS